MTAPLPRPEDHLGMVRAIAARLIRAGTARREDRDELISIGSVALLEAARRFDPGEGVRFATYAFHRVRGAMIDGIAEMAPLKRSAYRTARRHQAAGGTGVQVCSFEGLTERGLELPDDGESDAGACLDRARHRRAVVAAVAQLSDRKRRFVEGHYHGGLELKEIGATLGLSKSWASRLHGQAIADLRRTLVAGGLLERGERRSGIR